VGNGADALDKANQALMKLEELAQTISLIESKLDSILDSMSEDPAPPAHKQLELFEEPPGLTD